MTEKKIKVEFAPGCFDGFEGTQEELDGLIAEIQNMADSGALFEESTPLDKDSFAELTEEEQQIIADALESTRKLQ